MKKLLLAPIVALAAWSGIALADDASAETIPVMQEDTTADATGDAALPYTYAQASYLNTKFKNSDVRQNGYGIDGSFLLMENLFLVGSAFTADFNTFGIDFRQTLFGLGAGGRYPIAPNVDIQGNVQAVQAQIEVGGASDSDTGYQLTGGVRAIVSVVELKLEYSSLNVFDDTSDHTQLSGYYTFMPNLAAGLDLVFNSDSDSIGATVRYAF